MNSHGNKHITQKAVESKKRENGNEVICENEGKKMSWVSTCGIQRKTNEAA